MNKTLKNVAVFFGATTLLALCYPQVGTNTAIAQTMEAMVSENAATAISANGDEKALAKSTSNEAAARPVAEATDLTATAVKSEALTVASPSATAVSYSATAYALRGRTATGSGVRRGIIAADPRHLPLGTRVQITAGAWSGTYVVADTGGAIKGRKIDVWVPNNSEARKFGRRKVMLTVLTKARQK